jgi:hypothetical protein
LICLQVTGNSCGMVQLRTETVVENGTVEIEYYPSTYVMENSGSFYRKWIHSFGNMGKILILTRGSYKEAPENNKYVLTIYRFNASMNGQYRVYCGSPLRNKFTDFITVILSGLCAFQN